MHPTKQHNEEPSKVSTAKRLSDAPKVEPAKPLSEADRANVAFAQSIDEVDVKAMLKLFGETDESAQVVLQNWL